MQFSFYSDKKKIVQKHFYAIQTMYGEEAVSRETINLWYDAFKKGRWTVKLEEGLGAPIHKTNKVLQNTCTHYIISQGSANDVANNVVHMFCRILFVLRIGVPGPSSNFTVHLPFLKATYQRYIVALETASSPYIV